MFVEIFGSKRFFEIDVWECEKFRIYLIEKYLLNYVKGVWIWFKYCIGYVERLGYIDEFFCKFFDNLKGKRLDIKFWILEDLKKVVVIFDLWDYEERYRFIVIWFYFFMGFCVLEGLSLIWFDIDFDKKFLYV